MNQAILDIRDQVREPLAAMAEGQDCCSTSSTTSTRTFLDRLRGAKPDQRLVFHLDQAVLVETGYHGTESGQSPTARWIAAELPISGKKPRSCCGIRVTSRNANI